MTTEVALNRGATGAPEVKPVQRTFAGPATPKLWTKILSYGHHAVAMLMTPEAAVSLLPADRVSHYKALQRRWALVGGAALVGSVFVLGGIKSGVNAYEQRQARLAAEAQAAEAQAKAEAAQREAQARADAAAAQVKALSEAMANVGKTLDAFVSGASSAPAYFATVADMQSNPDAIKGIHEAIESAANKSPLEHVKAIETPGPWSAPVVFKALPGGDMLFGVAIDDNGARKALVLIRIAKNGKVYRLQGLDPAASAKQFDDDSLNRAFGVALVSQVTEMLARGFMPVAGASK